jgi:BirA family biotin operon repressor/biotin-[acetyl-CoA-carboxylase] ligase
VAAQALKRAAATPAALRARLIGMLADGKFHSGERLARSLRVSRTAVWKHLHSVGELGLELHQVPNRGYRLAQPIDLLDESVISRRITARTRRKLRSLQVLLHTDSTNSRLLAIDDLTPGQADVCIAEHQSAGRGRRGRPWLAPLGGGICLSLSWTFPEPPRQLSALSLAVGVALLRALGSRCAKPVQLKWPNDVLVDGRKLGGILCELRAEAGGPAYVVVGVGLNACLSETARRAIAAAGAQAVDLDELSGKRKMSRNSICAAVIDELLVALEEFQTTGLKTFVNEWRHADALHGAAVRVVVGETVHRGLARGIDADGALMVEAPAGLLRFISGEVSLRPDA